MKNIGTGTDVVEDSEGDDKLEENIIDHCFLEQMMLK
jgi:hypothetical protein